MRKRTARKVWIGDWARSRTLPNKAQRERKAIELLSCLDNLAAGSEPRPDDWRTLADVINVLETLSEQGALEIDKGALMQAQESMTSAMRRAKAGKALRLDGPGLDALRYCVTGWVEVMGSMTAGEQGKAALDTHKRLQAAIASGAEVVA